MILTRITDTGRYRENNGKLLMKFTEWFKNKLASKNCKLSEDEIQKIHSEVRRDISNLNAQYRRAKFKVIQGSTSALKSN